MASMSVSKTEDLSSTLGSPAMIRLYDYLSPRGDNDIYDMIDFLTEELGMDEQEACYSGWNYIIDENLKTHDRELLKKKLSEHFNNIAFIDEKEGNKSPFYVYFTDRQSVFKLSTNEYFLNIIAFFNYTRNFIKKVDGKYAIYLEPTYSESADGWVRQYSGDICYHFTGSDNVKKILKTGIRSRDAHSMLSFRKDYPKRIYLYCKPKYEKITKNDIDIVKNYVTLEDNETLACLRVDLNRYNVPLYKDTVAKEGAVFTYSMIPPECLKEIDISNII